MKFSANRDIRWKNHAQDVPVKFPARASAWMILNLRGALIAFLAIVASGTVLGQIGGSGWSVMTPAFRVQWPYNVPQNTRYWFTNGIYHCLVRRGDQPFAYRNHTKPRTEQRFPDYSQGDVQYQANLMAPSNETSYCIFQIHTGNTQSRAYGATTFMLFWLSRDGGSLHVYNGKELARDIGGQWFQLNVEHNLATRTIKVWINRELVWTQRDNGAGDFYMKDGVYQQGNHPSLRMDTFITDLHMWTRPGKSAGLEADRKDHHEP